VHNNQFAPGLRCGTHWRSFLAPPDSYRLCGEGLEGAGCPPPKTWLPLPRILPLLSALLISSCGLQALHVPSPCHHHFQHCAVGKRGTREGEETREIVEAGGGDRSR